MKYPVCLLVLVCAALASPAFAQQPPPASSDMHWGLTASFAPWTADDRFTFFYDAQMLDFSGRDLRAGITHGSTTGSEFSFLYVRKVFDEGGSLVDINGQKFVLGPRVFIDGFMAEEFAPFGTIARHVQIGLVIAGGFGKARGTATELPSNLTANAHDVLKVFAQPRPFQPLARAELAVAVIPAPGVKLRFSGGFDWPGSTRLGVTAMYFFGE